MKLLPLFAACGMLVASAAEAGLGLFDRLRQRNEPDVVSMLFREPLDPAAAVVLQAPVRAEGEAVPPAPIDAPPSQAAEREAPPPILLYPRVKYEDRDNIHPCAVKRIVAVRDPRLCARPCRCCEPACVFIQICVPPRGCPKLEVKRRDGSKIEYDYGDYEVEITSHKGVVHVDYDD